MKKVLLIIIALGLISCETETDKRLRENRSKMNDLKMRYKQLEEEHKFEDSMYKIGRGQEYEKINNKQTH